MRADNPYRAERRKPANRPAIWRERIPVILGKSLMALWALGQIGYLILAYLSEVSGNP
jgi:hypothetical protein